LPTRIYSVAWRLVWAAHPSYNSGMTTVSIHDIQRDPLGCLRRVEGGETLVVLRDAQPVAEIKPVSPPSGQPRPFGLAAGQFTVPDDFDSPLPDELIKEFEGP
jgi:antitoxin (DNA-binding transcriptional repressor) of toxin-antitoxin stability system